MATETKSLEQQVAELRAQVEEMGRPENIRAAQERFQQAWDAQQEQTYESKTLKLEIGALLRGQVRLALARDTTLEVKEIKGFFESVFILTARNARQFRELERVAAWIRHISAD